MAEDINVLLDQCDQRAQVLSQEADRAFEQVSQIVQFGVFCINPRKGGIRKLVSLGWG